MNFNNTPRFQPSKSQQKYKSLDKTIQQQNIPKSSRPSKNKFISQIDIIKKQITGIINEVARKKHQNVNAVQKVQSTNMDLLQYLKQQKRNAEYYYTNSTKILLKTPETGLYETRKPAKFAYSPYVTEFNHQINKKFQQKNSHQPPKYTRQDLLKQNQWLKQKIKQEKQKHIELAQHNQFLQDEHNKLTYLLHSKQNTRGRSQLSTKTYISKENNWLISSQIKYIKQKINKLDQSINHINQMIEY